MQYLFWFLALIAVIAYVATRASKQDYTIGSGMFKNSDFNLSEKEELSDKSYYNNDDLMM
ncbi:MAG: hypothetical protein U0L20_00855 [Ruminococcus sp.]|nr:hypothetical protein [Ruminococcus sp.]